MKKCILTFVSIALIALSLHAQAPKKFNYQGIARNSSGVPLDSKTLGLKISIINGSATGTVVYSETQNVTTNNFGLYHLVIGNGTAVTGTMNGVNWGAGNKYIKVQIDPNGGTNYVNMGTLQLLSVPFALYADKSHISGAAGGDLDGSYPNPIIGNGNVTTTKLANNAVTSSKIENGAVHTADIANDAITAAKIDDMGASNGQVLKFDGTDWEPASDNTGAASWHLAGNSANSNDFIGTTNGQALRFKVDNHKAGIVDYSGDKNTALGYEALNANTSGNYNTAMGYETLLDNTTGIENTAMGSRALNLNTTGDFNAAFGNNALESNTTGDVNTAIGYDALYANTTGGNNTAVGGDALYDNTTGNYNTAMGYETLLNNTTGRKNTASGGYALAGNTTGIHNSATGYEALYVNSTGTDNVAMGFHALYSNTTADWNTAVGNYALQLNTTGYENTALGDYALSTNTTGHDITIVGNEADVNASTGYSNSGAFGNDATISASNQYRIGNSSVTSIGGIVAWTNVSDGRFKTNIKENVPGLSFIELLRPVTYYLNRKKLDNYLGVTARKSRKDKKAETTDKTIPEKQLQTGFVAQEVEAAAKKVGYDFNGVDKPKNSKDIYGLRYAEFVVPLVKAVQEQQNMIKKLQQEAAGLQQANKKIRQQNQELNDRLSALEHNVAQLSE